MDEKTKQPLQSLPSSNRRLVLLICLFLLLAGLTIGYILGSKPQLPIFAPPLPAPAPEEAVACTQDAKQCPDGSFVGRDPKNNCEFTTCPTQTSNAPIQKSNVWKGLGVTFVYPQSWEAMKPVLTLQQPQPGGFYQQGFSSGGNMNMILYTKPRAKNQDGNYKNLAEESKLPNLTNTTLAGKDAIRAEYGFPDGSTAYQFVASTTLDDEITLVGIQFIVQPYDSVSIDQGRTIFNDILSSFKFTDQNPTPTAGIEGRFCGGIAANLPQNQCPSGYYCKLDGNYPDAGGKCVKE